MSLVSIKSVTKDFGIKTLFTGLTVVVNEEERIALIGANGSGKSTLLKLIAGLEHPDEGEVILRRDTLVKYVAQQDVFAPGTEVIDVIRNSYPEDLRYEESTRVAIERALEDAGFNDFSQVVESLSGGWRKRLSILRALVHKPELLLLDEPTNHLDIPGILWLEETISQFRGAVIFVSHDRYFIERLGTRVVELDSRYPGGYLSADGGYSSLIEKRSMYLTQLESYRDSLANKVRREVEWLRQGAKARTTKAKYRVDEAHRLLGELNGIQLEEQRAELGFAASGRKTKELLKAEKVSKRFDTNVLFKDVSFVLYPGSRLGIVGPNGSGKTTLLKTITGEHVPETGRILKASNLKVSYFGQMRQQLTLTDTLHKALAPHGDSVVFEGREIHVVTWAKRFGFRQDQLSHQLSTLSGGEQARVLLAKVALEDTDLLIFDEPTNDLDIKTLEVLERSFVEYAGAIIIVTHDRYLIDRVCTSVLGFFGGGDTMMAADYTQFEIAWGQRTFEKETAQSKDKRGGGQKTSSKGLNYQEQKELASVERKIQSLDIKKAQLESEMHSPEAARDAAKLIELTSTLESLAQEMESLELRWEELEAKRTG